jgi:glutamate racemase
MHYVADTANSPYGERDADHTIERSIKITQHLIREGANVVVVACNTATACAIDTLRAQFTGVRFVGVEPGIKPAAQMSRTQRIGVMATSATLKSARFRTLVERHAQGCRVTEVACPGLAAAIERGKDGVAEIDRLLDVFCQELTQARVDTLVLGCTHYPFVAEALVARLGPGIRLVDTASAISKQTFGQWAADIPNRPAVQAALRLETTGEPTPLSRFCESWLIGLYAVKHVSI